MHVRGPRRSAIPLKWDFHRFHEPQRNLFYQGGIAFAPFSEAQDDEREAIAPIRHHGRGNIVGGDLFQTSSKAWLSSLIVLGS